ncbi:hypothetical protein HEL88_024470, partial [Escherichia coli]|nr:hypothetical protein [Escherichia coli]
NKAGFNEYALPLLANNKGILQNGPIPALGGNNANGVLWVIPNGRWPGMIFLNRNGQMFSRIWQGSIVTPWRQFCGQQVDGMPGTLYFCTCSIALSYGQMVAGEALKPEKPGTWQALGDVEANGKMFFMRIV